MLGEGCGDDVDVAVGVLEGDVVEFGVEGDGERGGEGPGGGGPDDGVDVRLAGERCVETPAGSEVSL